MSKSDLYESEILRLVFQNAPMAGMGNATGILGSTVVGSLYCSLHSADPGETGSQSTNEVAYTSYARVPMGRSVSLWGVSGGSAYNATGILWPQCSGGQATATHFGIGKDASVATGLLYKGALTTPLAISNLIQPSVASGAMVVTED